MMQGIEEQDFEQKTEDELKSIYWERWIQYVQEVRKQRNLALRVFQFQNQQEQRRLRQVFEEWLGVVMKEKMIYIRSLRDQGSDILDLQKQQQSDSQMEKIEHAVKFSQMKLYTKSIRSLIQYGICCKKFNHKMSLFYVKYIQKKYFDVINQYKIQSKAKKAKKAQTLMAQSRQKQQEVPYSNAKSHLNFVNTNPNFSFKPSFDNNSFLGEVRTQPKLQANNNTYSFVRNPALGQSRRSQFSNLSSHLEFQAKRKFQPITQLPSISNLQMLSLQNANDMSHHQNRLQPRSPIKSYISRIDQGPQSANHLNITSLANSQGGSLRQYEQTSIKSRILELLTKQKLITLALITGDQFKQGMEYEYYRDKTTSSLRKIQQLKI